MNNAALSIEFLALFYLVPSLIAMGWIAVPFMTVVLIAAALVAFAWLKKTKPDTQFWHATKPNNEPSQLRKLLWRFAVLSMLSLGLIYTFAPQRLFYLPLHQPQAWWIFVALYCLLSVYPQELFFRKFFAERYQTLFPQPLVYMGINAASFAYVHVVFQNWVAVVLAGLAGMLFADTYTKTQSLRLVSLEHAMYGALIFSVGLDKYFIAAGNPLLAWLSR